jgi:fatty acid desaturase
MTNTKLIKQGILNALGVFVYTSAIAWLLFNGEKFLNKEDNFLMPVAMLLLFVVSAAITALLVFGKPVMFYLNNSKKEAVRLLIYTIASLLLIILIVFGILLSK